MTSASTSNASTAETWLRYLERCDRLQRWTIRVSLAVGSVMYAAFVALMVLLGVDAWTIFAGSVLLFIFTMPTALALRQGDVRPFLRNEQLIDPIIAAGESEEALIVLVLRPIVSVIGWIVTAGTLLICDGLLRSRAYGRAGDVDRFRAASVLETLSAEPVGVPLQTIAKWGESPQDLEPLMRYLAMYRLIAADSASGRIWLRGSHPRRFTWLVDWLPRSAAA